MTRGDIRKLVRFLSLIEAREVSDVQMDTLIDEGFHIVESKRVWPWAISRVNARIETTKGADKYTIPDFSHIVSILKHDGSKQLRSTSESDIATSGHEQYAEPELYMVEGGKVVLSPIPDDTGYQYDVIYTTLPEWRLSSEKPPFEEQFHTILVDWTLHRIWEREENFTRSNDYRSRFEARLMDMNSFYNSRSEDRPLIFGEYPRDVDVNLHPPYGAQPTVKGSS